MMEMLSSENFGLSMLKLCRKEVCLLDTEGRDDGHDQGARAGGTVGEENVREAEGGPVFGFGFC